MIQDNRFESQIRALEPERLVLFSLALTERMFPNFALFSRLLEYGDPERIRNLLDALWDQAQGGGSRVNAQAQLEQVEANLVDLDEFDMFGAIPAHDAMLALYSTLSCQMESEPSEAIAVSNLSYETVAAYIEFSDADDEMSDEALVRHINMHDLMQDEDAFQEEVLAQLQNGNLDASSVKKLRELAENQGVSNIGISEED